MLDYVKKTAKKVDEIIINLQVISATPTQFVSVSTSTHKFPFVAPIRYHIRTPLYGHGGKGVLFYNPRHFTMNVSILSN